MSKEPLIDNANEFEKARALVRSGALDDFQEIASLGTRVFARLRHPIKSVLDPEYMIDINQGNTVGVASARSEFRAVKKLWGNEEIKALKIQGDDLERELNTNIISRKPKGLVAMVRNLFKPAEEKKELNFLQTMLNVVQKETKQKQEELARAEKESGKSRADRTGSTIAKKQKNTIADFFMEVERATSPMISRSSHTSSEGVASPTSQFDVPNSGRVSPSFSPSSVKSQVQSK